MSKEFYSNGKLLITGEYAVLDGAIALSLPTKYGQSLHVEETENSILNWKSYDENRTLWFASNFLLKNNQIVSMEGKIDPIREKLLEILNCAKNLNPTFLTDAKGYKVTTKLNFPRNWGLGTSSTLLNNIATWANVNAYQLLNKSFGGSGYDIASAKNSTPILYQLKNSKPIIDSIDLNWNFKNHLFFVYLNKKQNSHTAITDYHSIEKPSLESIQKISSYSQKIIECKSLHEFELVINAHEKCISTIIQQKTVKELLFNDFQGAIKSLGAWGGDFILATGNDIDMNYFREKGYATILDFNEMVLK